MSKGFIDDDDYKNFDRDSRRVGIRVFGWSFTTVIAVIVIMVAVFALTVLWAPWKGKSEAFKQQQSANNRIFAQAYFQDQYNEILAADKKIDVFADAVKRDPTQINKTNLTGQIAYCVDAVADYNAEARKYLAKDFRDVDLPEHIDDLNSETDCKETKK